MNIIDKALTGEQNKERFEENIKAAIDDIQTYTRLNMAKDQFFELKELPTCNESIPSGTSDSALYLSIDLSGYGSVKPKWKKILIGTGAIEAIVQGVVIGSATQNPWLGIGVAAEEMTSEYLTWNGVDWLLGETYAPVTLEGKIVNIKDKKVIWKNSYFVTENSGELKKLGKAEKKDKSNQLKASLHKAERKLIENLNAYLIKEVM